MYSQTTKIANHNRRRSCHIDRSLVWPFVFFSLFWYFVFLGEFLCKIYLWTKKGLHNNKWLYFLFLYHMESIIYDIISVPRNYSMTHSITTAAGLGLTLYSPSGHTNQTAVSAWSCVRGRNNVSIRFGARSETVYISALQDSTWQRVAAQPISQLARSARISIFNRATAALPTKPNTTTRVCALQQK